MEITTYPLHSLSLEQAKALQFRVIDVITRHFDGREILSLGDLGVVPGLNKPVATKKAEDAIAEIFGAERALLVRGSGTGALRWALLSILRPGDTLLVHEAPVYPTTQVTAEGMGLNLLRADYNDPASIEQVVSAHRGEIKGALVQLTRQKIDDSYDLEAVVSQLKRLMPETPIVTDDNYAAMAVGKLGCQAGADLSSFSCFKLLGPEGVGALVGARRYIDAAEKWQYSGGSQVQGHEAMAVLRGLAYAPVALAVQSEVNEELVRRLNAGELPGVRRAFLANAQSKVLLVEFDTDCASAVLRVTPELGAASHPVGSESIYEFVPMIYRVSGTFRAHDPTLEHRMVRINPMRSGADTILRILGEALARVRRGE